MYLQKLSPFFWFNVLTLIYVVTSLVVPVSAKTLSMLHLSLAEYRMLLVTVLVPYILIWLAAFYSYQKSDQYARALKGTDEANSFASISTGVRVMAWGLAIPAILSVILNGIAATNPSFKDTTTIINNYATMLVPLIAFSFIGIGTRRLSEHAQARPSLNGIRIFALVFLLFGVYYTAAALNTLYQHDNPYHLSRTVLLLTVIVPYLYAWFMGILSCYDLALYARKIRGLLYKRALTTLSAGLMTIIGSSIFIQFVKIAFAYKDNVSINSLLLIIYVLLIIEAVGFILIANGARQLKRIEEI
jgi:hypothetical protein